MDFLPNTIIDSAPRWRDRRAAAPGGLAVVLNLIRSAREATRQEIERASGLGRAVVANRIGRLLELGLVSEEGFGPSTGGRAPRRVRFRPDAGHVLVGSLGTTTLGVALADLTGTLLLEHHEPFDSESGPEKTIERICELFDWMVEERPKARHAWAISIGVPGLVGSTGGRLGETPNFRHMPGWAEFPAAETLGNRYDAPVLIDNQVHHMALGELRSGHGRGRTNLVFVKLGTGITAAVCSDGRLRRGASGFAGDIGHVAVGEQTDILCRCGNTGCLEALAGGRAIGREGRAAAIDGRSPYLANQLEAEGTITAWHVGMAANRGDPFSVQLLSKCGQWVGETLATLVAGLDPSLVVIGGGVAQAGAVLTGAVRDGVFRRSRSVTTEQLQLVRSELGRTSGLIGGAEAALDDLFETDHLEAWVELGSPKHMPRTRGDLVEPRAIGPIGGRRRRTAGL